MSERKLQSLRQDLTCPITLELFDDPITVPCCGKACERKALVENLRHRTRCPLCNGDLSQFDAQGAARNVILTGLINTLDQKIPEVPLKEHSWSASVTPITTTSNVAELHLRLENAKFTTRPALFLAVLDRSGSMGGRPGEQVKTALRHIEALAKNNEHVKLGMLSYGSDCFEIKTAEEYRIDGGTNFRAAFRSVDEYLNRFICSDNPEDANKPNNISTVTVVFMTDGCDGSGSRDTLVPEFREMLQNRWGRNPLSVHTVGFGHGCDRELLEMIRTSGNQEGMYRYAEPTDDGDTLCQKLTGIFEISSKASTVPVMYELDNKVYEVRFPINSMKHGSYKTWVKDLESLRLTVNTAQDHNLELKIQVLEPTEYVLQRWLEHVTDGLASEVIELNNQNLPDRLRNLSCSLLLQNIEAIETHTDDEGLQHRLRYLSGQIEELKIGKAVNLGKLSDLRFSSLFGPSKPAPRSQIYSTQTLRMETKLLDDKPYNEPEVRRYSRNNANKERNDLQKAICDMPCDEINERIEELIDSSTLDDIYHTDTHGNNAMHLAAYCGHCKILKRILQVHPNLDLEIKNPHNETAVTLAIKKRGFHHTLGTLLDAGATIPRPKPLERYAIEHGFEITAQVVAQYGDGSVDVDESMKPEYVQFVYERAKKSDKEWDVQKFLNVALSKRLMGMARELVSEYKAQPTIDMLLDHCLPKKPDAPDTAEYLDLARFVLDTDPTLINQTTEPNLESPLFTACQKGSLPHVKFFLERKANLEQPNHKGNTPLWIACFQRYPCIIDELLAHGADINRPNLKGNTPLYGPCTRGNRKVAEQMIAAGADVEHVNSNGDTMILLCCRNGQYEVLDYLLDFVDEEFVNFKAHIDGFNAIMASAEQDRGQCIRVLQEYGVNLDQKTDSDNQILASATPMHIASYYNRGNAARQLLQLGANPNIQDANGQTPLHISVIQGNVELIKLFRGQGADTALKDNSGNVPMAYCRDRQDVRKALVDPVLDILMALSKGKFPKEDEKAACEILRKYVGVPGCLERSRVVDVQDYDGSTPLIQATMRGNYDLCCTLCGIGASATKPNNYGMTAQAWAIWLRNRRLMALFDDGNPIPLPIQRLKDAATDPTSKILLFVPPCPRNYNPPTQSGIMQRMDEFINVPKTLSEDVPMLECDPEAMKFAATLRNVPHEAKDHREELDQCIWDARVHVINQVVADQKTKLTIPQRFALALFANNPLVGHLINKGMLERNLASNFRQYAEVLHAALQILPPCTSEVFIGAHEVKRKMYMKGTEFHWDHFASGSMLWKVALENTPSFTSKSRKGTIFIVKSKTGRYIAPYSPFSFDGEVIWAPGTRFRVSSWLHGGDVIVLGQENIREHTFGIKEEDDERLNLQQMIDSEKSLVICLEEI